MRVLYEDNHLIAVVKPAGTLVQADKSGDPCLMDEAKTYLKHAHHKQGNVFLGLLHRLDRNVSGIVLFAKTSKGAARLSEQFRTHSIKKVYHALVEGTLDKPSGTLTARLEKDEKAMKARASAHGKECSLSYRMLRRVGKNTLVEVELGTGRFHQIRAQFALIGHPLVGDVKYGARSILPDQAIALSAVRLEFKKATGDEIVKLEITAPEWTK